MTNKELIQELRAAFVKKKSLPIISAVKDKFEVSYRFATEDDAHDFTDALRKLSD